MFHHESAAPDTSQLPTGAFLVRRNLASLEGYLVYDAAGEQVYRFKNHLAIAAARWTMLDAAGTEVATLVRPPMHLHPTFTVSRAGHPDVVIRKASFAPVHESWRLEGGEDGDVELVGDVLDHEFTFTAGNGRTVATASRRWVTFTDAYAVQASGLDPVLAIAAAVGIDSVEHDRR